MAWQAATAVTGGLLFGLALGAVPRVSLLVAAGIAVAMLLYLLRKHALLLVMLLLWYVPPQTAPGSLLDTYVAGRWVGVILIPALAVGLLANAAATRQTFVPTPIALPAAAVAATIVVSAVVNDAGAFETLASLALYLRYPLLFVALVNARLSIARVRPLVTALVVLTLTQVPEVLVRYFWGGVRGDSVSFTLGTWGARDLGVYGIYTLCVLAAWLSLKKASWWTLAAAVALLPVALIGEVKALLLAGPACFGIVLLTLRARGSGALRKGAAVALMLAVAFIVVTAWGTFYQGTGNTLYALLDQTRAFAFSERRTDIVAGMNRVAGSLRALDALRAAKVLTLGTGPGSSFAGTATGRAGAVFGAVEKWNMSQVAAVLWDCGALGLGAYLVMLASLLPTLVSRARSRCNPAVREFAGAALGMWVYYSLLGPQYDLVWRIDSSSFVFWTLVAAVFVSRQEIPGTPSSVAKLVGDSSHQLLSPTGTRA